MRCSEKKEEKQHHAPKIHFLIRASASRTHHELNLFPLVTKPSDLRELFTLCSSFSTPGIIIMMDTRVPRKRKKVKRRREMVEFLVEGQQPQSRHGAEPQRQDTCNKNIPASEGLKLAPKHVLRSNP